MVKNATNTQKSDILLKRGVRSIIERKSLEKKLELGKPLRVKHGVDPTTSDLHLGYAVVYEKLRQFQELGHTIVFLIGTFTGRFGDPTDREKARNLRSKKEVEKMAANYIKQLEPILDTKSIEVRENGEWYDHMSAEELLQLMSNFTVSRLLERDMFEERIKKGREIGLHEPVYPVLQGYDSVMIESDVTVIGTDQLFNELQARPLQKAAKQKPQDVMAMPMLIGTDGTRKMSQSYGNTINFTDEPNDMYGKVMSIPDKLIMQYFELITRVTDDELVKIKQSLKAGENPRDIKARLAREIVTVYHSPKAAQTAEKEFTTVFQKKEKPSDIPAVKVKKGTIVDIIVAAKLAPSRSEARRLVEQGGVKVDDKKVTDPNTEVKPEGQILQIGKRKFAKLT